MTNNSLRILVVEDDFFAAQRLANEIRAHGDHVVGPFADVHEAIHRVGLVQAAILDIRVQDENSFQLADSLTHVGIPFVFLTGYDRCVIPPRFSGRGVYTKPSCAAPLLDSLHREHARIAHRQEDSLETVVIEMLHRARGMMPDEASVERLVEAVLLRAIHEQADAPPIEDLHGWLFHMLEIEYQERGKTHLQ
ncbi:response regulator [Paracoccus benzoatiresistens]|uniref:Response regulator n=1 Tax=Paracoccus benzoatiresistens TaxID=2997341 RepID=A0ABT4J1B7_9RHOB|nr:response regulator [Paracoccus sp. EF6]MCZ0960922.1 response regulator [Paracoccus sp. EF6]